MAEQKRLRKQGKGARDLAKFLGPDGKDKMRGVMLGVVSSDTILNTGTSIDLEAT